ncbi:uncharacterized protein LOC129773401 [Toxorhynchites rutilus septentrionalis]|uniref:uncharacterized protein LOC129773401 n=1 Tax=Toxorhynchites rutilus septentrionalis TaxID=329112 RepID=UPI00247B2196|nr:uncharacterized protein LOC129773401 [Toxorhynchites rutilus septentrionalis]
MTTQHSPIKTTSAEGSETVPIITESADDSASFKGFAEWEVAIDSGSQRLLSSLFRQRDQVNQKIVRVQNALMAAGNQVSMAQLKTFTKNIDAAYSEFSGFHSKVMAIIPDEAIDIQEEIYSDFENRFNLVSTTIEELLQAHVTYPGGLQNPTGRNQPPVIIHQQALRVPLPTFDGQYRNWPKFKAMFQDLMSTSTESNAIKLYHLEKALIGDASGVIDASTIRDNNYEHAWRILENRFDNKRLIVDTHIQSIKNLNHMTRKSSKELRDLIDECTRHVEGLRFMGQELLGISELLVVNILTSALDRDTRESWEKTLNKEELPNYKNTIGFLQNHYLILERCEATSFVPIDKPMQQKFSMPLKDIRSSNAATSPSGVACDLCSEIHLNYKCPVLRKMSIHERIAKVKSINACYNCLRKGHHVHACSSERTCSKCSKKHHTLLHLDQFTTPPLSVHQPISYPENIDISLEPESQFNQVNTSCFSISKVTKQALLLTATVNILDRYGNPHMHRALLDSGSQVNFLTESVARTLDLTMHPTNIPVVGIGGSKNVINKRTCVTVKSNYSNFKKEMECLIAARVTGSVPSARIDVTNWGIPSGLQLADPSFDTPDGIDLLIGAEFFFDVIMQGKFRLRDDLPLLQETVFGWVVTGAYYNSQQQPEIHSNVVTEDLENQEVEEHFQRTHRETGKFVVHLPFRETVSDPSSNRALTEVKDREPYTTFDESSVYRSVRTLGILWDPIPDSFWFEVPNARDVRYDKLVTNSHVRERDECSSNITTNSTRSSRAKPTGQKPHQLSDKCKGNAEQIIHLCQFFPYHQRGSDLPSDAVLSQNHSNRS